MALKSSLMLRVVEVGATAAGLEAAEKKNSSTADRTLEALQGTLEYFGTMCPSASAATHEPLDRKLTRIQVASSLMKNSGIRYGEISGQCAGIGVLRHLESLRIPLGSVEGSSPGGFADDDLLRPSSEVASAWEAFRSTWKTDHKAAAKAWIDEARRQKQAQTRPPLPAAPAPSVPTPPTDPQVLSCPSSPDFELLEITDELRKEWANLEGLRPYRRSRFSVPRGDEGEITLEVRRDVLAYIKEEEKTEGSSSSEPIDWSDSEYRAEDPAEADSERLLTWAELQEEQRKLRASKKKTIVEECEIVDLIEEIDMKKKKETDPKKKKPKRKPLFVKNGAVVVCRVQVNNLICIENFSDFPQLGRFTLRTEGRTVAVGKVVAVPPAGSPTFSA
ncbi:hypothetical protein GUJ93_ZPchr0015g6694 [Zizania palustris]|uniref:GTP-eEF1A C-terminal domain-containing protein n=1 Tax=Zizania palustris TaxID=103762 RepID=A0A8J5TBA0_ZIZPA|nr:hypothetical protein GUJ93_ZPchr0015g6694 [Zizania palustris]